MKKYMMLALLLALGNQIETKQSNSNIQEFTLTVPQSRRIELVSFQKPTIKVISGNIQAISTTWTPFNKSNYPNPVPIEQQMGNFRITGEKPGTVTIEAGYTVIGKNKQIKKKQIKGKFNVVSLTDSNATPSYPKK